MAKGTNTKLLKCDGHCMVLVNMHRTGERKKNLLFLFLANAGLSHTKSGISQLPDLSNPAQRLGQASACMVSSARTEDVWAEIAQTGARQESSWEEDPAVTNLAQ